MKKIALLTLSLVVCVSLMAQVPPQGIQFQSVARTVGGVAMANTAITVRFSIRNAASTIVYQESHGILTDDFGLFNAVVGSGTASLGTFAAINWGASTYSVDIEVDDGSGFSLVGNCTFQSVPYALYADKANMAVGDLTNVNLTGLTTGQVLSWNGAEWVPANNTLPIWSQLGNTAFYNQGRVGIGTYNPEATFHLADSGVFFQDTATLLVGGSMTGAGSKIIWHGRKGAFRAGILSNPFGGYNYNNFWNYDSIGYYSFAGGYNSRAKGFGAFAFGSFGWADGSNSVAFFGSASGNRSYTFGGSSRGSGSFTVEGVADDEGGIAMYGYTGGRYGVSIGGGTTGLGASSSREDYAIAIGWNSDARGQASIALGPSDAYGYNSFSTGWVTEARGNYSSTFGYQTNSYPYASMALGRFNQITGDSASWVTTDPIFIIGDGTSNSNRSNSFVIQKNGQTAVGYNTPVGMLNVSTALGSLNNGGLDVTNSALLIGTTATGIAFDANQMEGIGSRLYLNYNSAQELSLCYGGGFVGVGTANPAAKFEIEQSANLAGGGLRLNSSASGNYWDIFYDGAADLQFARNGVARASIDQVNGAYNQLSDLRMKKDIAPLEPVMDKVMQLKPARYHYLGNQVDDDPSLGFIAQEVEEVMPEIVNNKEGMRSLSYDEFSVLAIKAIQEQQAQIEALKAEIQALKKQVNHE